MVVISLVTCLLLGAQASDAPPVAEYGHAFQAPGDFTDEQYSQIASRFSVFTVEKRHAYSVYGDASAPSDSPQYYKSWKAAVETARKIKQLNSTVQVLMHWNAAVYYGLWECEEHVTASMLMPDDFKARARARRPHWKGLYNYSSPEFREWWVDCAADSILNSEGMLDGLFLDSIPKLSWQPDPDTYLYWNDMVDSLVARIGSDHLLVYNGFYLPIVGPHPASRILGADDFLANVNVNLEIEHFGRAVSTNDDITIEYLSKLNDAINANPTKRFFAHGPTASELSYVYGCFLMVAPNDRGHFVSVEGFRIADGFNIENGVLDEHPEYSFDLGDATGNFTVDGYILSRVFEQATVEVDLANRAAYFNVVNSL